MGKIYWTFEKCREEAIKFNRKIDFLKANKLAYHASYKKGWLDKICTHMEISGDKYNRCIYAYEFEDRCVYIGLTYNLNDRDRQHLSNKKTNNSCVKFHIKNTGIIPSLIKLTDYITYSEASVTEGKYLNNYRENGWKILNKSKTGSLGASNLIYTKEKCKEIIDNCKYLSDLYKSHSRVLLICKENGWFSNEINSLVREKKANGYWTKDKCLEVSKNVKNTKDFINKYKSAYRSSLKNGWTDEIFSNMESNKKKSNFWTKEMCKKESLKYKNRFSLQKGSRGAYKSAYRNGWLDELFPKL